MAVVPTSPVLPSTSSGDLPRRDEEARAHLRAVAERARPFVAAGDRLLPVTGPVGERLPAGGMQRGSTISVDGSPGSGATTVALTLAAAATGAGEWAAIVDPGGTLGGRAAVTAGVELERLAVPQPAISNARTASSSDARLVIPTYRFPGSGLERGESRAMRFNPHITLA
jgi:hypothetical protein